MLGFSDVRSSTASSSFRAAASRFPLRGALVVGGGLVFLCGLALVMPSASSSATGGPALLSLGNVLAALLLLGGAALALYLRAQAPAQAGSGAARLRPLGTLPLAQGQQLRLVACGPDVLLLGITPEAITLLRRYDRDAFEAGDEALEAAGDTAAPPPVRPASFADLVRHHASSPSHA